MHLDTLILLLVKAGGKSTGVVMLSCLVLPIMPIISCIFSVLGLGNYLEKLGKSCNTTYSHFMVIPSKRVSFHKFIRAAGLGLNHNKHGLLENY